METIQTILKSFNDNLGFVTFIVGAFAIYLYLKQRKDKKRDAARLVLQEIRYAEQKVRRFRESNPPQYNLADRLLPTNSWNDNIHLFIKDLKEGEIDMISAFYAKARYIDFLIQKRSEQKTSASDQQFAPGTPMPVLTPTPLGTPQPDPAQFLQIQFPIPSAENITIGLLQQTSFGIEYIYNTPVVEKLRRIAERRWYEII